MVLHLATGEQADRMILLHESEVKLRVAAMGVADPDLGPTVLEFALNGDSTEPAPPAESPKIEASADPDPVKTEPPKEEKEDPKKKLEKPKDKKLPELPDPAKKPEPPKDPPKLATADPPKKVPKEEEKPKVAEAPKPPPELPADKKTSVQQHVDKEEEKNLAAKLLAEKNHHVKPGDETQATITSVVEDVKDPTPGTHQGPPAPTPGNGDKDKIAHDADRPGAPVAPNVVPPGAAPTPVPKPDVAKPGKPNGDPKLLKPGADGKSPPSEGGKPAVAGSDGKGLKTPVPGSPEILTGPGGTFTVAPPIAGSAVAAAPKSSAPGTGDGKAKVLPQLGKQGGPKWVAGLGFGAKGENGKPSIAIDDKVLQAAVGVDELDKLKKVEAETKLSQHKGSWKSSDLSHWKSAIENYVPWVKPGNQTNLGTAAAPFATYLAKIHLRIHPIFGDGFIESLGDLPGTHPLNDIKLVAHMEIVLKPDGTIHHLGIVKHSGVTMFDVAALDAVERAAPFGKAPEEIVSPDGFVYLHWEFHRDDQRCSTTNARPYKLKEGSTPKEEPKPPPVTPPPPPPENEKKMGAQPKAATPKG